MTIRASDILPGPLPIWDQGTMMRGLTLSETRALIQEFRQIREDYGRLVVAAHKVNDEHHRAIEAVRLSYRNRNMIVVDALRRVLQKGSQAHHRRALKFAKCILDKYDDELEEFVF